MKRKKLAVLVISTVIAAVILGLGVHWWRPGSSTHTAKTNVHLTDYTDNDGALSTVVLSGAIGDFGRATRAIGPESVMTLHLSRGTLQLNITDLAKRFTAAVGKAAFNQTTCSGNVSITSSVPIIANSGTGTYKGARGNFTLTMSLDEVVPRQPNCSANSKMLEQIIVSSGWGQVSL